MRTLLDRTVSVHLCCKKKLLNRDTCCTKLITGSISVHLYYKVITIKNTCIATSLLLIKAARLDKFSGVLVHLYYYLLQ